MPGLSKNAQTRDRQLDALARNRFVLPSGDHDHPRRCTATSKRSGRRCRNLSVTDMAVCRFHGARAGRPKKDGSPPVTRQHDATQAHTRAKARQMEKRARSRLRRQGIAELAERDHAGLDRETLALARQIYAQQLLRAKGSPFANETLAGAAFALCVMRATGEIATAKEFDARCRGVLGFGLVPTPEERHSEQVQMADTRAELARLHAGPSRGTGGW